MDSVRHSSRSRNVSLALVTLLGLLAGVWYASVELAAVGWDPAGVISFGEAEEVRVAYAERQFSREIPLAPQLGHDGRFFFIQAMDPFLLAPEEHARYLDRPTYRAQRMLYPALAGLVAPFGPEPVAWAMIALNVIGFAVGTWATSFVAQSYGVSSLWGLSFVLNPGIRFELDIDGAGVLAMAALMLSILAIRKGRFDLAIVGLTVSVLSREVMLIAVVGLVLATAFRSGRQRLALFAYPASAAILWRTYVEFRLGSLPSGSRVEEIGWPLEGFIGAFRLWIRDPGLDLALGAVYLAVCAVVIFKAWRDRSMLLMPAGGFALVGIVLSRQVWFRYFDISRALAPMITLYLLSVAASLPRGSQVEASQSAGALEGTDR